MTSSFSLVIRLPCPRENDVYAGGGGETASLPPSISKDSLVFVFVSLVTLLVFEEKTAVHRCTLGESSIAPVPLRDLCDDDSNAVPLQTTLGGPCHEVACSIIAMGEEPHMKRTWTSRAICVGGGSVVASTRPCFTSTESFNEGCTIRNGSCGMTLDQ